MTTKTTIVLLVLATLLACGDAQSQEGGARTAAAAAAPRKALDRGLAWLRAHSRGGIWMAEHEGKKIPDPALTAFAITPIAAALPKEKRASDPLVRKACAFLLESQRKDGAVGRGPNYFDNYYTSASLMALSVVDAPSHAEAREKMKKFLLSLQRMEKGRTEGGFGYNKRKGADLSNAQFAIESLRTAGIAEDHPAMKRARAFLQRVQNRSENPANKGAVYEMAGKKVVPGNDGSAGYEAGVSKAGLRKLPDGTWSPRGYGSMTYALLKCYLLVGLQEDDARVKAAVGWLSQNYTWDTNPGFDDVARTQKEAPYWGLFYYYMTAAKALRLLGTDKLLTPAGERDWRADLAAAIVARQGEDGSWVNTKSSRWEEKNPVIVTAYATIALQEILGTEK